MKHILAVTCLLVGTCGLGKGLKDLKPDAPEDKAAKEETKPEAKKKLKKEPQPEVPADKAVESMKKSKDLGGKLFIAADLGIKSLAGSTGDWSSGFGGGFSTGYQVTKFGKKPIKIFATYSYSPIDVIVDQDSSQYRGVVEAHYFGAMGTMALDKKLSVYANADLGLVSAKLDSINTIPAGAEDPEEDGAAIRIGGGAHWLFKDNVAIGGGINIAAGSFTGWDVVVGSRLSL